MVGLQPQMQGSGKKRPNRSSKLLDFAQRLLKATDQADAFNALARYCGGEGFADLTMALSGAASRPEQRWSSLGDVGLARLDAMGIEAEIGALCRSGAAPVAIAWSSDPVPGIYSFFDAEMREAMATEGLRGGIYFQMEVAPGRSARAHALLRRFDATLLGDETRNQFHIAAIQALLAIDQLGAMGTAADLTPREFEMLGLASRGLSMRAMAALTGVSEATVKFHLAGARKKLGARSTSEAVAKLMSGRM